MHDPVRRALRDDRCEASRVAAGGEFSGESTGGYRQYGTCHVQVGAEIGDRELKGRDSHAARSEYRHSYP